MRAYPRTTWQQHMCAMQVGESFIHPRRDDAVVFYASSMGRQQGKKFRTRTHEFGRRVERLK